MKPVRNLVVVLGDQLSRTSAAFRDFDAATDCVWMAENQQEATHVWCHKARLVLFFSAMRHFRDALEKRKYRVIYHALEADGRRDSGADFAAILAAGVRRVKPDKLVVLQPGDHRVQRMLQACAHDLGLALEVRDDDQFHCTPGQFDAWADGRKRLVMEDFYREMRRQYGVLMRDSRPEGGQWNLDKANREAFGRQGPGTVPRPPRFRPDAITRDVMDMVEARFGDHPGRLDGFNLPVTRRQALHALDAFVARRLPDFGTWQDAIWAGEHLLYHSQLSSSLNLHLITPQECIEAAVAQYEAGNAPLNSVEGFVRQILGWREFVRGVYWRCMPDYAGRNALAADLPVPAFFWDGDTDMACVADAMAGLIDQAYAHHIIRLMVLGLFALNAGVDPRAFHDWHMAMYTDAIDWVSLPNALGMSQFGDGGLLGTKPYCASGNYINRMSNHCAGCRYDYKKATGADACPFTTLYWDFLDRHAKRLDRNRRMNFQMKNLEKKRADGELMTSIRAQAGDLRQRIRQGGRI